MAIYDPPIVSKSNCNRLVMATRRTNPIPIPSFVTAYFRSKGVTLTPVDKFTPQPFQFSGEMSKILERGGYFRTQMNIERSYSFVYDNMYGRAPLLIQQEYFQLVFPVFIQLAVQLYQLGLTRALDHFINRYRGILPAVCQTMIDDFLRDPENFEPPIFEIHLTNAAVDSLLKRFESGSETLVGYIISTKVKLVEAPPGHPLAFISEEDSVTRVSQLPIIPQAAVDIPVMSAVYLDATSYKTCVAQKLPDVGSFTVFNHHNQVNCIQISQCCRLMAVAEGPLLNLYILDGSTKFSNGNFKSTITTHRGNIMVLAISPNSVFIASGGVDGEVKVCHTEATCPIARFSLHIGGISALVYDKTSKLLASAGFDKMVYIWTIGRNLPIRALMGHNGPVTSMVFSDDSSHILTVSRDLTARSWDLATGKCISMFYVGNSTPLACTIDPSNEYIAIGCLDGSIHLWSSSKGKRLGIYDQYKVTITDLKFTIDASMLIVSYLDGTVLGFPVNSLETPLLRTNVVHSTADCICITNQNCVIVGGRSFKGNVAQAILGSIPIPK